MSLRQKLLLLTMLTSGIGVLLGCGAYLTFDLHDARVKTVAELESTANLVGTNAAAALAFDDALNGARLLEALRTHPDIRGAALYKPAGEFFASYLRADLNGKYLFPPAGNEPVVWAQDQLAVVRPIVLNDKMLGTIRIESDLKSLHKRRSLYLQLTATIAAGALFIVYFLTALLGRTVTRPILQLAGMARAVTEGNDYSQRAPLLAGREIRQLGADLNHMLEEISKRDAALVDARNQLELRVTERTFELEAQIAERQRAEVALRQSEDMFRTLSAVAPVGIVLLDVRGEFTYVNQNWQDMTELSSESAMRRGWLKVVHADDIDRVQLVRNAAIASGQGYAVSYRLQTAKGLIWVDSKSSVIKGKAGEAIGYVAVTQDVTQRQTVAENLRIAKEAAEAANRAKSEFLANMSHEIRTPMNGIIGMTELALDTELDQEQRNYLSMVKSSADALLGIVNDILDFSKIEAGRLELESAVFSLHACIEDALRPLALRAHEKGLELTWFVEPRVPEHLRGDATRLRQVLINLAGNAVKFTKAGNVSIYAELVSEREGSVTIQLTVADTGIGIPPEKHKQIFAAFSQADASTTREFGGTGLGLSISARLVELMGGHIGLESEPGKGAKFHFTAEFVAVAQRPAPAGSGPDSGLKGVRALIIDDDEINRHLLERLLTGWGMETCVAAGGKDALTAFEKYQQANTPFTLALVDKNMPELNGYQTIRRLRELPGGASVAVLILTSSPSAEDVPAHKALNIVQRITKPILREGLLEAMRSAVHGIAPRHAAGSDGVASSNRPLRILLAEDNAVNQKLAARLLEKMGHQVTVAHNGKEAVELTGRGDFELILMDIQMPLVSGIEATEMIRQAELGTARRIPIVALTANAMKGDQAKYLAAGMDGYVSKPIRAELLRDEIARVVRIGSAAAEPEERSIPMRKECKGLDRQELLSRVEHDEDLARELLGIFQSDAAAYRESLRAAVQSGDAAGTRSAAHAFKGMLANLAAGSAAAAAARLEEMAKAEKVDQFADGWKTFEGELEMVLAEVGQLLTEAHI